VVFISTVVWALLFLSSLQMLMAPGVACVPAAVPNVFASFHIHEVPVVVVILAVDIIHLLLLIPSQLSASYLFLALLLLQTYLLLLVFLVCWIKLKHLSGSELNHLNDKSACYSEYYDIGLSEY
jgi:hypothetical protein